MGGPVAVEEGKVLGAVLVGAVGAVLGPAAGGAGGRDRGVGGDRAVVHDAGTGHKVRAAVLKGAVLALGRVRVGDALERAVLLATLGKGAKAIGTRRRQAGVLLHAGGGARVATEALLAALSHRLVKGRAVLDDVVVGRVGASARGRRLHHGQGCHRHHNSENDLH